VETKGGFEMSEINIWEVNIKGEYKRRFEMAIKEGDWVAWRDVDKEWKAFLVDHISRDPEGIARFDELYGGESFLDRKHCTLLTPYASIEEVRVGDRCVVVKHAQGGPATGSIVTIVDIGPDRFHIKPSGFNERWQFDRFAPLPTVSKTETHGDEPRPEKTAPGTVAVDWNDGNLQAVDIEPVLPCPHPEWEGVWDYCGDGYYVIWVDAIERRNHFAAMPIMGGSNVDPWQPGEFWTQIEPAPDRAIAHPTRRRTGDAGKAHRDYIPTPWDPYGEG
jgi:hypothetical protein